MRWWRWWLEPTDQEYEHLGPLEIEASEEEILQSYYPSWCDRMRAIHKADLISDQLCIEDFVAVHWAWDATSLPRLEDDTRDQRHHPV